MQSKTHKGRCIGLRCLLAVNRFLRLSAKVHRDGLSRPQVSVCMFRVSLTPRCFCVLSVRHGLAVERTGGPRTFLHFGQRGRVNRWNDCLFEKKQLGVWLTGKSSFSTSIARRLTNTGIIRRAAWVVRLSLAPQCSRFRVICLVSAARWRFS